MENRLKELPSQVRVRFHQEEDGRFWAEAVDLPGCYTQGDTLDKTLANMKDAIFTYFEVPKEKADPSLLRYEGETRGEFVMA